MARKRHWQGSQRGRRDNSRRVPAHREDADHCLRCECAWPCKSIVIGRDSEARPAVASDFESLDFAQKAVTDAALRGLVRDTGARRKGRAGLLIFVYERAPGVSNAQLLQWRDDVQPYQPPLGDSSVDDQ